MRKLQPNTVWDIRQNAPATDPSTTGLGSQRLDGGAIQGIQDNGNRVGVPKTSQRSPSPHRGTEGATAIQFNPEQTFSCQTSESGGFLYLQIPNHGVVANDVISFRTPFQGENQVLVADATGFSVNGYLNQYTSGVTGVTFAKATPQSNPVTINGIDLHTSDSTQRDNIHRLRVMNEDNIHTIMWVSGFRRYLGTRLDLFARPYYSGGSGVPWPIHTGYQRTRYYVPEGFDPEATVSGGRIAGKFTYSDGGNRVCKTTKWYGRKE